MHAEANTRPIPRSTPAQAPAAEDPETRDDAVVATPLAAVVQDARLRLQRARDAAAAVPQARNAWD